MKCFCYQDSPRRAHSIAAQGGINAAKNYQNDGDSIYRLFYDTVKGGDFRAREANVYRLAQVSVNIIDQCVAQGVPFAREYGGAAGQPLLRRRPGLAHLLRPRPDRPAAPARRLPGPGAADRPRQGEDVLAPRDARPGRGRTARARHRRPRPGDRRARVARRRRGHPRHRRLRQRLLPLDQRQGLQRHRDLARLQEGRRLRQPLLHADPPHLHPGHRRPPEQAHADERVAAQRRPHLGAAEEGRHAAARPDPRGRARLLPGAQVPELRQPGARATSPRAPPRRSATRAAASARAASACTSTSPTPSSAWARPSSREKYGNLLRHVRAHHRRGPLQGPDAHLPRHPLHDGRAVGGLQPDEHHPRPVRARRGELLRPRRQPPGRQRADAGPGRRLLRHPLHDRRLPGDARAGQALAHRPRRVPATAEAAVAARTTKLLGIEGQAHRRLLPPRARPDHVGVLRHGPQRAGPEDGPRRRSPPCARSSGRT